MNNYNLIISPWFKKDIQIKNPTINDIKKSINLIKEAEFIILDIEPALNNRVTFIQATNYDKAFDMIDAEIQVIDGTDCNLINYGKRLSFENFMNLLENFLNGNVPNITDWEYVGTFGTI